MKKNLLFLFALICSMSLFTACSDDDESLPIDEELAGAYKGGLDITVDGAPLAKDVPQKIYISKAGTNQIKLELKEFSFMGIALGTIEISNSELVKKGDEYTFTGSQPLKLNVVGDCSATVVGTMNGKTINVNIDVNVPALKQTVKVNFTGNKLAGTENAEAKITAFTFDNELVVEQPVLDEAKGTITFKVGDTATDAELAALVPTITISDKAVVSPVTGVAQDFSAGKSVTYTVVAEDGTVKTYIVSMAGSLNVLRFSFEEWENVDRVELGEGVGFNGYIKPKPTKILATSSEGAAMLGLYGITDMPVFKTDDKKDGDYAIRLVTVDTSLKANAIVPALTAGSLFTGIFDIDGLGDTFDKLNCTLFGISYDKKPLRFKGWYKYTPGVKFIDGSDYAHIVDVPNKKDECSIAAILYKVDADDEVLTGHDINTSPKRVAVAVLADGTAKTDYTGFDLPFTFLEGKSYEAGAKYKLAIVCSSSKEGDAFKGAGGSTLILDELEVIGE